MGEVIAFRARSVVGGSPPARQHLSQTAPTGSAARSRSTTQPRSTAQPRSTVQPQSTMPRRVAPGHEPLWREVTGAVLRAERLRQRRTLAQTAERAGMSVQYLSELERGRKEASSEMLAAACGSLGLGLGEFARRCAGQFGAATARPSGPLLMAA